jgi:hypothetical protein
MKIKDPVLVYKRVEATYEVDVEDQRIIVNYSYDMDNEADGGWDYDLRPCFVDLTDEEIEDLEEEFFSVLTDLG